MVARNALLVASKSFIHQSVHAESWVVKFSLKLQAPISHTQVSKSTQVSRRARTWQKRQVKRDTVYKKIQPQLGPKNTQQPAHPSILQLMHKVQ